jgi:predicted metal-dependent hydrolase
MKSSTPSNIHITPRNPSFDFGDVNKVWMADAITSHFMNALSIFIPFSERSVIEILRNNIESIEDEELKKQIKDMAKQEGRHAAMHRKSNERIRSCYSGLSTIEKLQQFTMKWVRKLSSPAFEAAIPAAFEHFTSAVSRNILSNQAKWTGNKNNASIDFVIWHCLEELEHQAVGHDAYKALYKNRLRLLLSLLFWSPLSMISVYGTQLYLMHKDRITYKPKNWLPYLKFIATSLPLFYKGTFQFCRKHYQPWSAADKTLYQTALAEFNQRYTERT